MNKALLAVSCTTLCLLASLACGGSDDDSGGAAGSGTAGSGTAGSGTAGTGTAGSGTAGSGTAGTGTAGSGTAGTGTAGSGTAGTGTAGSGTAGTGTAGTGTAGSGTAGSGGGSIPAAACTCTVKNPSNDACAYYPASLPMVDALCTNVQGSCSGANGTFAKGAACPSSAELVGCCLSTDKTSGAAYPGTCYYKTASTTPQTIQDIVTKCMEPNNKVNNTWSPGPAAM